MIPFDQAVDELRRGFDVAPGALDRCEEILEIQHLSLAKNPPLSRLPESVRIAAATRMRSSEIVIARERLPIEEARVIELVRAFVRTLLDDVSGLDVGAEAWVEAALPAVFADDAAGVHAAAVRLDLPPDVSTALLREALKPEMLRTSSAFTGLAHEMGPRVRCPLCGELPSAATEAGEACCRWCGLIFRWDSRTCGACGQAHWRTHEIAAIIRHAKLMRCAACGEVVKVFRVSADPLLLSLFVVLTAPFDLAAHVTARDAPRQAFPVF